VLLWNKLVGKTEFISKRENMPELHLFQIDSFSNEVFRGNPTAICPLESWLEDRIMQAIAMENNLAETAFFVPEGDEYHIRWFTPKHEVDLCGHATLGAAFVIFTELERDRQAVRFASRSGPLGVTRKGALLTLDFPAYEMLSCPLMLEPLAESLGRIPKEVFSVETDKNYYAVYENEDELLSIRPDFPALERLHPYGVVITAPGRNSDCASRYFVPSFGISEDPVTGSIHCALVPFWAKRLNKSTIYARQVSERGGELFCEDKRERVEISGYAVKYLDGIIHF
jgi:PhzF family phenazine biosynthesis protein